MPIGAAAPRSYSIDRLREEVAERYCADNGRPGIYPKVPKAAISAPRGRGTAMIPDHGSDGSQPDLGVGDL